MGLTGRRGSSSCRIPRRSECDILDTDHDWLSEHGMKKLTELPLGPETPKFGAWFEKEIVKPAAKMRDRGTPYG